MPVKLRLLLCGVEFAVSVARRVRLVFSGPGKDRNRRPKIL